MKSALCRTLSKIFCSWGLMKELSKEEKGEKLSKKHSQWPEISSVNILQQCVPWMLSICPILSAAPRTLHSVLTILSALASDRRGESSRALMSTKNNSTHRERQREAVRSGALKNILQHQVQQHKQDWLLLATTVRDLLHENNELLPWTELNWIELNHL